MATRVQLAAGQLPNPLNSHLRWWAMLRCDTRLAAGTKQIMNREQLELNFEQNFAKWPRASEKESQRGADGQEWCNLLRSVGYLRETQQWTLVNSEFTAFEKSAQREDQARRREHITSQGWISKQLWKVRTALSQGGIWNLRNNGSTCPTCSIKRNNLIIIHEDCLIKMDTKLKTWMYFWLFNSRILMKSILLFGKLSLF